MKNNEEKQQKKHTQNNEQKEKESNSVHPRITQPPQNTTHQPFVE